MEWNPIITDINSVKYREKLSDISGVLQKELSNLKFMGLLGGKIGIALFFFYYGRLTGEEKYFDLGFELVSSVVEKLDGFHFNTFAKGQAGVGWALEHLSQNEFMDIETNDMFADLDIFLYNKMEAELQQGNYDPFHGAIGYGTYFLSRLEEVKTNERLAGLVDGLEKLARKQEDAAPGALTWETIVNPGHPEQKFSGVNTGLIHGVSGIMAVLAKIYSQGIYKQKVLELLNGAVGYLLKQSLDKNIFSSCFPIWIKEGTPTVSGGYTLSYGDICISLALWQAAIAAGNNEWKEKAIDTMLYSVTRTGVNKYINDGSLTIGTSGIAHVYGRMYNYTGMDVFKKAAQQWWDETLKMAKHPDGFAGFKAWRGVRVNRRDKELGIVEGIAGIGLALISAISPIEPAWDRCFLIG
ncbi:MAG: lantibiotic biosynthesis protein [Acidobacteriota bacterium]|nr:lantibiotic biosynthesis protein [Acidobacteriota bacterium]